MMIQGNPSFYQKTMLTFWLKSDIQQNDFFPSYDVTDVKTITHLRLKKFPEI